MNRRDLGQRQCKTCIHFERDGPIACLGSCRYPSPQIQRLLVNVYVRDRELPCRDSQNRALWKRREAA